MYECLIARQKLERGIYQYGLHGGTFHIPTPPPPSFRNDWIRPCTTDVNTAQLSRRLRNSTPTGCGKITFQMKQIIRVVRQVCSYPITTTLFSYNNIRPHASRQHKLLTKPTCHCRQSLPPSKWRKFLLNVVCSHVLVSSSLVLVSLFPHSARNSNRLF